MGNPIGFKNTLYEGDVNTLKENGIWAIQGSTTNVPINAGLLLVLKSRSVYPACAQLFFGSNNRMYHRALSDAGVWSSWYLVSAQ